jgi:hypothetical protein
VSLSPDHLPCTIFIMPLSLYLYCCAILTMSLSPCHCCCTIFPVPLPLCHCNCTFVAVLFAVPLSLCLCSLAIANVMFYASSTIVTVSLSQYLCLCTIVAPHLAQWELLLCQLLPLFYFRCAHCYSATINIIFKTMFCLYRTIQKGATVSMLQFADLN